jgi:signal transduction histidine kinase
MDTEETYASITQLKLNIIFIAMASLFITFILLSWLSNALTRPIIQLSDFAKKVGFGDLTQSVTIDSKDEIGQLANSFNKMTTNLKEITASRDDLNKEIAERKQAETELEAKNAELERFTYTVSHDLKSPLITIRGFLGLLDKDANSGDFVRMRADIKKIFNATEKMHVLLEDLLELSRVGKLVNPFEEVSLGKLANEIVNQLEKNIKDIGIHVEINPELPLAFGDYQRLLEVFQNLIENAMKFMGDQQEPRIEIGSKKSGSETVCYVRDNGIGIDAKHHDKIFDLFSRLNPEIEGTGVGLAIVKRIIELHGGRIWVESEDSGKGSTFCFVI